MGVGGADENRLTGDSRFFLNAAAHFGDLGFPDEKGVEPDESDHLGSVVKDRRTGLAGIVKVLVISFRVASGALHPDLGGNVALGETGLHRGRVKRVESRDRQGQTDEEEEEERTCFHFHSRYQGRRAGKTVGPGVISPASRAAQAQGSGSRGTFCFPKSF